MTERGPYYEDFRLGEVLEHQGEFTLTPDIFGQLVTLNGFDDQAIHVDRDHAISQGYRDIILPGPIVYTVVFRLTRRDVSWVGINVKTESMVHKAAVYPNDTLRARSTVEGLDEWKGSRGKTHGLVRVQTVGLNQEEQAVIEFSRSVLNPFR